MKKLIHSLYLVTVFLVMAACSPSLRTVNITKINLPDHANDTFVAKMDIEPIRAYNTQPSDYIPAILDSLVISQHIFDIYNAEGIYSDLKLFYQLKDGQTVWVGEKSTLNDFDVLLEEVLSADRHGLNPEDYGGYKLLNLKAHVYQDVSPNPLALAILDVRTSISCITYAYHLANGATPPRTKEGLEISPVISVASILADNSLNRAIKILTPSEDSYRYTMFALAKYRAYLEEGLDWDPLPTNLNLRLGDSSQYVPVIAEHLTRMGDLASKDSVTNLFDSDFELGVMNFQRRHGLEVDGILGKSSVEAFNISLPDKIHTLEMNLERMRWLPEDLGSHYFFVNIPDFTLKVYEKKKEALQMRTIVGDVATQTPMFKEDLEYIVFSPTWTVPKSIVLKEIIPHLRRDPTWLSKRNYKLYPDWRADSEPLDATTIDWSNVDSKKVNYRVVQNPGPTNALGLVKFIMPNSAHIYLHDTPSDYLFSRNERAFSHGCIRLEKPQELAGYLLKNIKEWDEMKIQEAMSKSEPEKVRLPNKIPVYLTYRTAWGEKDGTVHFRSDIYGYDQQADYGKYASMAN